MHFLDHDRGGRRELDEENRPVSHPLVGQPDLHHVYRATMHALLPAGFSGRAVSAGRTC